MASAVVAGTIADVDWLSYYFGPSAYLTWHKTYLHSIFAAVFISAIIPAMLAAGILWEGFGLDLVVAKGKEISDDPGAARNRGLRTLFLPLFTAALCVALLHVAMDACQSVGAMIFWPFSSRRFAADWLPRIDPWILAVLIAAIAVPELLHLVSSEIGAKAKKPRGQSGAIIGLVLVLAYASVRAILHSNVLAMMNARTFHGEAPRRANAFPESLSVITWHGIAETESALNEIEVNVAAGSTFDPDTSLRLFKPQDSPALDAARSTDAAKRFLATAQIPKATVEKNEAGYVVILRDLSYAVRGEAEGEVVTLIELDLNNRIRSEELVWARDLRP